VIYAFARAIGVALAARGFPYKVAYEPFLDTKQTYGSGVVISRTRGANEAIGPAIGPRQNPKPVMSRLLSADVYVMAKSSKAGARVNEHEDECDPVVDAVLIAADGLIRGKGSPSFAVPEARYLSAQERSALGGFVEQWPGVVYFLRLIVPRGIARLNYRGEGAATAKIAEIDTTLNARLRDGATGDDLATFDLVAVPDPPPDPPPEDPPEDP